MLLMIFVRYMDTQFVIVLYYMLVSDDANGFDPHDQ